VKQQFDHSVAARGARNQGRDGGSYASQTGQGRKKRGKRIGVHGLTVIKGPVI
jgi:hypothetical protein